MDRPEAPINAAATSMSRPKVGHGPETPPLPQSKIPGVIFALRMDGSGHATEFGQSGQIEEVAKAWEHADPAEPVWLHLDRNHPTARTWLSEDAGISDAEVEALLQVEPRPRVVMREDRVLLILRGINLNPEATEDPILALRLLATPSHLVTVRVWRIFSVRDVRVALIGGEGPNTVSEAITEVVVRLAESIASEIEQLESGTDAVEESLSHRHSPAQVRGEIAKLRRQAILLRRYLAPQHDAIAQLARSAPAWFDEPCRQRLAEVAERLKRDVDALDQTRDHLSISHDELTNAMHERMNRTTYLLTIVAALFLPLTFVTGLLGINVGGIPLADDASGFWIILLVCVVLSVAMAAGMAWVLRKL
jgi:zinc transporter